MLCVAKLPFLFSFIFYLQTTIREKREERKENSEKNKETTIFFRKLSFLFGAEGETRTLAPVTRPTPLAGAPRHQLEYFCMVTYIIKFCCCRWRREWDSNPRYVAVRRFSRPFRYNHFGISP